MQSEPSAPGAAHEALLQFLYRAPMGLLQTTHDGEITTINPAAACLLMPLVPDGNLQNLFDVLHAVAPQLRALAAGGARPDGMLCEALRIGLPGASPDAQRTLELTLLRQDEASLVASLTDATLVVQDEQRRSAQRMHDMARLDAVTALPNRAAVMASITQALEVADDQRGCALLFINCDRFNAVNLSHGAAAGDELLRQMAQRLTSLLHDGSLATPRVEQPAMAARLGGDEFAVLLPGVWQVDALPRLAQALLATISLPYVLGGQALTMGISMGVACAGADAVLADALLQQASIAMRDAKRAGGARWSLFAPAMQDREARRGQIEDGLRRALSGRELFVVYQPIVPICQDTGIGMEALVRWRLPDGSVMSPLEFIGVAEESDLICALGAYVLREACAQFMHWQATLGGDAPCKLSVNLSRRQLADVGLITMVQRVLRDTAMPAQRLQLEVTESLAAQDDAVQTQLHALKALGLGLALDDFGTGYSSLACLHLLPVDVVKIDRSFVQRVDASEHHLVLIEATVRVAQSLGLATVAEGVETVEQAAALAALGCHAGQGYWYARPLLPDDATAWLLAQGLRAVATPAWRPPAPQRLAQVHDVLLDSLQHSALALALLDPQDRLAWANRSFRDNLCQGLGDTPSWEEIFRHAHATGRGLKIETNDIDAWLQDVRQRFRQSPSRVFESDLSDGRWMRVIEETGGSGWLLIAMGDVTRLKVTELELRRARDAALHASVTDPLTALPNRRFIFAHLDETLQRAGGRGHTVTLCTIDLDFFKSINDSYGHASGDRVLVAFSGALAEAIRDGDCAGRIGGEEFLLVLNGTDTGGAKRLLQRLRSSVHALHALLPKGAPRLDFSSGLATARPSDSAEALYQRADAALYIAKAQGRGQDQAAD